MFNVWILLERTAVVSLMYDQTDPCHNPDGDLAGGRGQYLLWQVHNCSESGSTPLIKQFLQKKNYFSRQLVFFSQNLKLNWILFLDTGKYLMNVLHII